jgi:hypothetical protein
LGAPKPPYFFLPVVVGGLADAHLPAYLGDSHVRVGLAQGKHDLNLGKRGLFQGKCLGF